MIVKAKWAWKDFFSKYNMDVPIRKRLTNTSSEHYKQDV